MEERCENCRFYSELKINKRFIKEIGGDGFVSGFELATRLSEFQDSHCCLLFVKTENDPYVFEVTPNDTCECFTVKPN